MSSINDPELQGLPNSNNGCQGSMTVENQDEGRLLYSGIYGSSWEAQRTRMTVYESADNGKHWQALKLIDDGTVSNSSIIKMWNGEIALLYEAASGEAPMVFVPEAIYFDVIDTGRQPHATTPMVDPNTLPAEQSYDMDWLKPENTEHTVFLYSFQWFLIVL